MGGTVRRAASSEQNRLQGLVAWLAAGSFWMSAQRSCPESRICLGSSCKVSLFLAKSQRNAWESFLKSSKGWIPDHRIQKPADFTKDLIKRTAEQAGLSGVVERKEPGFSIRLAWVQIQTFPRIGCELGAHCWAALVPCVLCCARFLRTPLLVREPGTVAPIPSRTSESQRLGGPQKISMPLVWGVVWATGVSKAPSGD